MYLNERNKTGSSLVTVISSDEHNLLNEKGADVRWWGGGGGGRLERFVNKINKTGSSVVTVT